MGKGIFITAVDTEAGKTMCACALSECLTEEGLDVGVYKPVLSGAPEENGKLIREDALMLKKASGSDDDIGFINPYCFAPPVTPAHAACMENVKIDRKILIDNYNTISAMHDITIVEGAGGLMVPVTDDYLIVDLIKDLGLSTIVITDTKLGRINHTLMTMKVLETYGINVIGTIINRYPKEPGPADRSLLKYLMIFDKNDILGMVPEIEKGGDFYSGFVAGFKDNIDIKTIKSGING